MKKYFIILLSLFLIGCSNNSVKDSSYKEDTSIYESLNKTSKNDEDIFIKETLKSATIKNRTFPGI